MVWILLMGGCVLSVVQMQLVRGRLLYKWAGHTCTLLPLLFVPICVFSEKLASITDFDKRVKLQCLLRVRRRL